MMDIQLPPRIDGGEPPVLKGARQITIIGANGSGKSRFCSQLVKSCGDKAYRISALAEFMKELAAQLNIPFPAVLLEPGRSIVADAGMTVYTVCSVKRIPGYKSYAIVDGGMADNPRYCLYGSRYTVLHAQRSGGLRAIFDLAGRACESGDIIQPAISLPNNTARGDLVAVCTTGAYNYAMASHYNRIPHAPIVMLSQKGASVAVKRETLDQMIKNDV